MSRESDLERMRQDLREDEAAEILNVLAPLSRRGDWWATEAPVAVIAGELRRIYGEKGLGPTAPNVTHYTVKQSGDWIPWVQRSSNPPHVHSLRFDDGREWDVFNGWRVKEDAMLSLPMPLYRCHKEVRALKIGDDGITVHSDGSATLPIADGGYAPVTVEAAVISRHFPSPGDYLVFYEDSADGYKSISPRKAFEDGYTRIA